MGSREELVDRVVTSSGLYGAGLHWPNRDNLLVGLCSGTEWLSSANFPAWWAQRWKMPTGVTSLKDPSLALLPTSSCVPSGQMSLWVWELGWEHLAEIYLGDPSSHKSRAQAKVGPTRTATLGPSA
jgi:hypothetical protein